MLILEPQGVVAPAPFQGLLRFVASTPGLIALGYYPLAPAGLLLGLLSQGWSGFVNSHQRLSALGYYPSPLRGSDSGARPLVLGRDRPIVAHRLPCHTLGTMAKPGPVAIGYYRMRKGRRGRGNSVRYLCHPFEAHVILAPQRGIG